MRDGQKKRIWSRAYLDFAMETAENVQRLPAEYVYSFNNRRPAAALGYKSSVQYKIELSF